MRQFDTARDTRETIHAALTARDTARDAQVKAVVRAILDDVKARGDAAVLDYTRRFDWPEATIEGVEIPAETREAIAKEAGKTGASISHSLNSAALNISDYHWDEKGRYTSWFNTSASGNILGQMVQPVHRAGIYVPGGKAAYPSTVLMAVTPAVTAGVKEIIVCTPANREGSINPAIMEAVDWVLPDNGRLFKIGGAQAIAAMAYGTETVPKCDVIVGPGNAYVNTAKKLVYGEVGIDMLAGPSEVAIVADEGANPAFVAADLLAQTEHGHDNRGVLFSHSSDMLEKCKNELATQREALSRKEILAVTANNLIFVKTNSLEESLTLSNVFAPEHLELMVREPLAVLPLVKNAGAVLLGDHTSAPIGDYWAGPSHTLPTAGAARYASPLSVATFMKRTSVLYYSPQAAQEAAEDVARFAEAEGFDGHAQAARLRGREAPPAPNADARREAIDAVIFDMDGVLLDISGSIRVVNCLSVPFYLRTVLGWPAPDDLLTSQDIEMFKNAGGFNDDWDLTYALVLHYVAKGHEHPSAAPETLNVIQPNLTRYAARIKERGGWLRAAEEIAFEHLTREDRLAVETDYRKYLIKQVFQEMFAGEHCERLYGYAPTLYTGLGYINHDRPLLDLAKLPAGKMLGVQTGRTLEEARIGLEMCGLAGRIPETQVVTKSDGFQKPQPGGLAKLAERMGFANAVYIGDALDDLRTVKNFNAAHGPATFLSAQVLTGPAGKANEKLFRTSGADILAADVNEVLDWLEGVVTP